MGHESSIYMLADSSLPARMPLRQRPRAYASHSRLLMSAVLLRNHRSPSDAMLRGTLCPPLNL